MYNILRVILKAPHLLKPPYFGSCKNVKADDIGLIKVQVL